MKDETSEHVEIRVWDASEEDVKGGVLGGAVCAKDGETIITH